MNTLLKHIVGALALTLGLTGAAQAQPTAAAPALKRGVNMVGYDPIWNDPAQARWQPRHMQAIRDGGFDHVRLNLQAFQFMDAQNQLSAQWWKTFDSILDAGLKAGLQVIVDEHNFNECETKVSDCRAKLKAFWQQVAPRLRDAPNTVLFEILNEPHGEMDAVWNEVLAENLKLIRETNPTRRVVVGPKVWNSLDNLDSLQLPEADRNLVVTFHYYTPLAFTHQGASWSPEFKNTSGVTWGTAADQARLRQDFDKVKAWSNRTGRPILMGEFGALETAGMSQRVNWTSAVARLAEAHGFAWSYWQFDSDFIVWDMKADTWVKPIHDALISGQPKTATSAAVRATDPALDYLINTAQVSTWSVYGDQQASERVPCSAAGNSCLRVTLKNRHANPWDVGATAPVHGAIRKGDKLQLLVWGRLASTDDKATAKVKMSLQLGTAPYTPVVEGEVMLTSTMAPLVVQGVAGAGFAENATTLALHLGQLDQPVELSAPYVLRNYQPSTQ